jgi:hypothetical protein
VPSASEERPWEFARPPFLADGSLPGPGWLDDPVAKSGLDLRWWDGQNWSDETRQRLG